MRDLCTILPHLNGPISPGFNATETMDLDKRLDQARAEARAAAEAEAHALLTAALAEMRGRHDEQMAQARQHWAEQEASRLASLITAAIETKAAGMSAALVAILCDGLSRLLPHAAVAELAEQIRHAAGRDLASAIKLSGPEDLVSALHAVLQKAGYTQISINHGQPGPLTVDICGSLVVSTLSDWLHALEEARA